MHRKPNEFTDGSENAMVLESRDGEVAIVSTEEIEEGELLALPACDDEDNASAASLLLLKGITVVPPHLERRDGEVFSAQTEHEWELDRTTIGEDVVRCVLSSAAKERGTAEGEWSQRLQLLDALGILGECEVTWF